MTGLWASWAAPSFPLQKKLGAAQKRLVMRFWGPSATPGFLVQAVWVECSRAWHINWLSICLQFLFGSVFMGRF